jgi:hypothetical protein
MQDVLIVVSSFMSSLERLLGPSCTEGPECRCGEEMKVARTEQLPDKSDAQVRIYNCHVCSHEMHLTVWADDLLA